MFSNTKDSFDKDMTSTRGYECDDFQFGESSIQVAQHYEQFDLEQSCLMRLKTQRQKIEELTRLYEQNEKQLLARVERQKRLNQEKIKLEQNSHYKKDYEELKRDYENLYKKDQLKEYQLAAIKDQLNKTVESFNEEINQLKGEIRFQKDQILLTNSHWKSVCDDKDEQYKRFMRSSQQKQYDFQQQIIALTSEIDRLKDCLEEKSTEIEQKQKLFYKEIKMREDDQRAVQRMLENVKKQYGDCKIKLQESLTEMEKQKVDYSQFTEQLKHQIKLFKKDQDQKENSIYEYKEMIKKCDLKNQSLESTVTTLKMNMKKFKANTDNSLKKLCQTTEQDKNRLQMLVNELKLEIEDLMQCKAAILLENKKLKSILEKKEQQERQRKLMLMTQFREIDKLQKVVNRII